MVHNVEYRRLCGNIAVRHGLEAALRQVCASQSGDGVMPEGVAVTLSPAARGVWFRCVIRCRPEEHPNALLARLSLGIGAISHQLTKRIGSVGGIEDVLCGPMQVTVAQDLKVILSSDARPHSAASNSRRPARRGAAADPSVDEFPPRPQSSQSCHTAASREEEVTSPTPSDPAPSNDSRSVGSGQEAAKTLLSPGAFARPASAVQSSGFGVFSRATTPAPPSTAPPQVPLSQDNATSPLAKGFSPYASPRAKTPITPTRPPPSWKPPVAPGICPPPAGPPPEATITAADAECAAATTFLQRPPNLAASRPSARLHEGSVPFTAATDEPKTGLLGDFIAARHRPTSESPQPRDVSWNADAQEPFHEPNDRQPQQQGQQSWETDNNRPSSRPEPRARQSGHAVNTGACGDATATGFTTGRASSSKPVTSQRTSGRAKVEVRATDLALLSFPEAECVVMRALRHVSSQSDPALRRRMLRELQRNVHPDKWPAEQQPIATKLFQVLQGQRAATLAGRAGA